jgi:hypothetical protein
MPDQNQQPEASGGPFRGLDGFLLTMMTLWVDPTPDPDGLAETPARIGPLVLALWTLAGTALAAAVAGARFLLGAGPSTPFAFAMVAPMTLPLLLGVVRLPIRRLPALALALVLGALVGVACLLALRSPVGGFWTGFLAMAAAALTAAASYGAVARGRFPAAGSWR